MSYLSPLLGRTYGSWGFNSTQVPPTTLVLPWLASYTFLSFPAKTYAKVWIFEKNITRHSLDCFGRCILQKLNDEGTPIRLGTYRTRQGVQVSH